MRTIGTRRHDHLTELTRGLAFPLPALDIMHIEVILDLLELAHTGIKADYATIVSAGDEADINALMVERLNHLVGSDPLANLLIRAVSRGTETKNYSGERLEMRPDIQISLTSRSHLFPFIVECKLIDPGRGKGIDLYCLKGLSRFTLGDYAWADQDAMMVAYVRDATSIGTLLRPYLEDAASRVPPEYAVRGLPVARGHPSRDVAQSVHGRYFNYEHSRQTGEAPGDIAVWHMWLH